MTGIAIVRTDQHSWNWLKTLLPQSQLHLTAQLLVHLDLAEAMSLDLDQPRSVNRQQTFERKRPEAKQQQTYDLVCIGFGTTALPLAASLAEKDADSKTLFVERKSQWEWQPAHVLPDKQVGSSFLRDLATTHDPRSSYTFMNFLHSTNQLIRFANNAKLAPSRRLMAQYFRWAASKVEHLGWVIYGQEAVRVQPVRVEGTSKVSKWTVELRSTKTQAHSSVLAKRVVFACGAQPHVPQSLARSPLVLHSSQTGRLLEHIGSSKSPLNIAVIGAGQEAAEIFEHLSGHHEQAHGKHSATIFYAHSALRPEDESPKIQDLLNKPESTPGNVPPEVRQGQSTTPTVDLHTLEEIYAAQYTQKIHERDSTKWRFQMKPLSEVVGTQREADKVRLELRNPRTNETSISEGAFDIVVAATGYSFAIDKSLIEIPGGLLDGGAIQVDREYRVNFRRGVLVAGGGVWLLGSLEDRHVRNDDFSWAAERAQRVTKSILAEVAKEEKSQDQSSERAMI